MAKLTGVTIPSNLAGGDIITETWVDAVSNSVSAIDGILGQYERIYTAGNFSNFSATTETNIFSAVIPANSLATNNYIIFEGAFSLDNDTGADQTPTMKIYFGAHSSTVTLPVDVTVTSPQMMFFKGVCRGVGAATQKIGLVFYGNFVDSYVREIYLNAYEDSTLAKTLKLTYSEATATTTVQIFFTEVNLADVS